MKLEEISHLEALDTRTLREIQETNRVAVRNPTVYLLLKEISRLREVVREINRGYASMRTVWREDVGGETVGMHHMRIALAREMNVYGPPKMPWEDEAKERSLQQRDERRFMENIKVLDNVRKNQTGN